MAKTKLSHKAKVTRVWACILTFLLVFMLIATVVTTQVRFLYSTINSVMGGESRVLISGDPTKYQYYEGDYDSKKAVYAAANQLNERIVEEGIILLKNEDVNGEKALPLSKDSRVTIFGRNSVEIVHGGSGSNAGDTSTAVSDVYTALSSHFTCNNVIHDYYKGLTGYSRPSVNMGTILTGYPISEASLPYPSKVTNSYANYSDAAIVFLTRTGGEGFDLPRTMFADGNNYSNWDATNKQKVAGARSVDDHYLQLDANETAMLKEACDNFDNVVVVVNSASPLELGFLDDPSHYAYNEKIKAAVWLGHPGSSGLNALGRVLDGTVNPSGKTVDTFSRDFKKDPSWENFGNYLQKEGNRYSSEGRARNAYFVEYREGLYVGYRYYETMAAEKEALSSGAGETWYNQNVIYPFGYGLSYTDFEWTVEMPTNRTLAADSVMDVNVTVKNTGSVAGKEVVQLYYTAPYTAGGIEKSHVVLGDFAKTDMLEPGATQTLTLSVAARDMASYDYSDANGNGFKGYELEHGTYTLRVGRDAHTYEANIEYTLDSDVRYTNSDINEDVEIGNLFDDVSGHIDEYLSRENAFANYSVLSGAVEAAYRNVSKDFINTLTWKLNDKASDPWYSTEMPKQEKTALSTEDTEVQLYELIGKDYDDPLWDTLLNQLSVEQMSLFVTCGNYRTLQIENIGKPLTLDPDGPMGFAPFMGDPSIYDTCYYASECILAASYNVELAREFGNMVGNESLVGNEAGDGRTYSGWYAPAVNIHRSQFGGRNFEYYSEDGLLAGKMATAVIQGANEKGVYTYLKHFALNEQETDRDTTGLITWANEQAMRELYFKPFELSVKVGKTTAMMSSFNRLGSTWAGGSYNLLTALLRDEWGFKGMVITDYNLKNYMNVDQMVRAGGDLVLSADKKLSSTTTATDVTLLRQATKNILYTVANSNAMNGYGDGVVWGYAMPQWVTWCIYADVGLGILCAIVWVVAITRARKDKEQ